MGRYGLYTVETAIEALRKFDIKDSDLIQWEQELGLSVPVDEYGRKQYSPHHINLFKNIRKHLAMGRTLDDIRKIISLPPLTESQPRASRPANKSAYASTPSRPQVRSARTPGGGASGVIQLVNQLTREKDQLYKKLMETEKLNSHLYSANSMFHRKVKDLSAEVTHLRESSQENHNIKLMGDKDKLHKQLITTEKLVSLKEEEIGALRYELKTLQSQLQLQEEKIQGLTREINPDLFLGDWLESGQLLEISYDNFGINIESERVRLFRISERPARIFGNTAIIQTSYQYETNNLWKRNETLTVALLDENTLEGELTAEYILDGVPVAKAIYRVTCTRNR